MNETLPIEQEEETIKPWTLTRSLLEKFGASAFNAVQKKYLNKSALEAEQAGERLGKFHYMIDSKHRDRTHSNLSLVFKDWSDDQIKATGKEVFKHFGRIAGDFMRSPGRSNEEVLGSMVEVEGLQYLEEAEERGKGVIMVTGHFGNWERFSQWVTATGRKLNVIARDANQAGVQARILEMREQTGVTVLSRGNSARLAMTALRRGERIGLLADQNSKEAMVPFFGFPSGNVLGPAVLHQRTEGALLPSYCVWLGPCSYKIVFLPLIDPENKEEDRIKLMEDLNKSLESMIRRHPSQWLWMHDRWKLSRRAGLLPGVPPTYN